MGENFSVSFEFPTNLTNAGVGSIVYLNTAGTQYEEYSGVIPSGANPTAIVLAVGSASGYARLVHCGDVPASVSGLSASTASAVIADATTGMLARKAIAALSSSDWFCGYADALGNVSFIKPFKFITGQTGRENVASVSSPGATSYTCSEIDSQVVIVNSSGAAHSTIVTLPLGVTGRRVSVKDGTANAGAGFPTTLTGNGANVEQFSGASTYAASISLNVSSASWDFMFDGTNWRLV